MAPAEFPLRLDTDPPHETQQKPNLKFGIYLPKAALTNPDIESWGILTPGGNILTAENIEKRTGVKQRYVANESETPFSMALHASQEALDNAGEGIGAVIVSTSFPAGENLSAKLQKELGISGFNLDVHAACSGFTLSLAYIKEHEQEFLGKKVLLVATEKYSPHLQDLRNKGIANDPSLAQTIFSDGAIAVAFEYGKDLTVISAVNKHFPEDSRDCIKMPVDNTLLTHPTLTIPVPYPASGKFEQDGAKVYKLMCEGIPRLVREAVHGSDMDPSAVQAIFLHQGSGHMAKGIGQRLSEYSVFYDFQDGNLSSASIPKSLSKASQEGKIKKGDTVVLAGFGAGLFASIAVVKFG